MQKLATSLRLFAAALALCVAGTAFAQIVAEPAQDAGDIVVSPFGSMLQPNAVQTSGIIYDNTGGAANFGFSSTDLNSVWGDQVTTTGTGILSQARFSVFNSGSSAGTLLTATVLMQYYDAVTSSYLGGFSVNVNFGAGLGLGFYSVITVPGLDVLNIQLTTPNVIVLQKVTAKTGSASRLGFVSLNPITVGSSANSFYASSATVGGGVAGFYLNGSNAGNPAYQILTSDFPVPAQKSTWGRLKSLY
ncbi:MAG: hypothetical protein U0704_16320 [Candidatus Eisenbacteria bacterium]